MWDWLDQLHGRLSPAPPGKRRWLHRAVRLSGPVSAWLSDPARTQAQKLGFAELLLQLDADPIGNSAPILQPNALPGMRWASFDAHKAIFVLDLASGEIRVALCV